MGLIRVLTDRVANQIAAGEVVERPASVCKELIENSLDAAATSIAVDVRGGGRQLIKVRDNGSGMNPDDAMLAFERHATSKLREPGDLLSIGTLGFRGEALPSIASVARVTLSTSPGADGPGTVVEVHGGRMRSVSEAALAPGTSIEVRNLFYNVPARRKFLRTERTELSHVVRATTHYGLAHLDKRIRLSNERGSLLDVTPVATLRERVYQVFGGDTLDRLVEVDQARSGDLRLSGFVSEPQAHRSGRKAIYTFVNRRLVRDPLILRALSRAYENLTPKGVYPFALLFLDLPPSEVDVNVHPAKTEVRFRGPSSVFDFVRSAVRSRLIAAKPASDLPQPGRAQHQSLPSLPRPAGPLPGQGPRPGPVIGGLTGGGTGTRAVPPRGSVPKPGLGATAAPPSPSSDSRGATGGLEDRLHSRAPLVERSPTSLGGLGRLQLLGQLHDSFIIAAGEDGIWVIDQHVAHERILFEQVLEARLKGTAVMQRLLTPIVLTLTPGQMVAYRELEEEFLGNGFEIEPFGNRTVAVKGVPAELSHRDVEALVSELLDDSQDGGRDLTLGALRKRMAATIACHAAIKINMSLAEEKMRWLLEALAKTDCPMSCPHGRPIALRYGTTDILKAFHRL